MTNEVREALEVQVARVLAYEEWPLASEQERQQWASNNYTKHLPAARQALASLSAQEEEVERLKAENARLTEHCATIPKRPDDIGRLIQCHFDNLKAAKEAADKHAIKAMKDREHQSALISDLVKALEEIVDDYKWRLPPVEDSPPLTTALCVLTAAKKEIGT